MGGLSYLEQKDCELIIHDHERDLCVTMYGWVDVRIMTPVCRPYV